MEARGWYSTAAAIVGGAVGGALLKPRTLNGSLQFPLKQLDLFLSILLGTRKTCLLVSPPMGPIPMCGGEF